MIILSAILLGFFKAVSDCVQHFDVWTQSVFSHFPEESFFGSADKTWKRKHNYKGLLGLFLRNWGVWLTDIWHFSQMAGMLSVALFIPYYDSDQFALSFLAFFPKAETQSFLLDFYLGISLADLFSIGSFIFLRASIFHLFYKVFLRLNSWRKIMNFLNSLFDRRI